MKWEIGHQYWIGQVLRGLFTGLLAGLAVSLYSRVISLASTLNSSLLWPIVLIPAGAVATQYMYKRLGQRYKNSTLSAIDDINTHRNAHKNWAESQIPQEISPRLGLIAFLGAFITHFTGASGGKEGAGVQLGLACSSVIERCETYANHLLHRQHDNRSDYYLMCGAAAAFSSLFNAPIAGLLFGTMLASPRATRLDAWLCTLCASFTGALVSQATGTHVLEIPAFIPLDVTGANLAKVVIFALLTGLYSRLFCWALRSIRGLFRKRIKNEYVLVGLPATILLALSLVTYSIFGSFRYNGLGGDLLYDIIQGNATNLDDLIKLLMVALTYASGFVGGEVVPLMIVGAGFGMSMSFLMNAPLSAFAVLGSCGMLSGGTNLPLVCFALGLELYGYSEPGLLFLMCALSFVSSGRNGIYPHQNLPYR